MKLTVEDIQRKEVSEYSSQIRGVQLTFLNKQTSEEYSQMMEGIMKTNLRKQSQRSISIKKEPPSSLRRDLSIKREPSVVRKEPSVSQFATEPKGRPRKSSVGSPDDSSRLLQEHNVKESLVDTVPEEKLIELFKKKVKYRFGIKQYFLECLVAYVCTFSILYLIQLAQFPYFALIFILALAVSIEPYRLSNSLVLIALPLTLSNYFLTLDVLTYPGILICYLAVVSFNQKHKIKVLFVFSIVGVMALGFLLLPAIHKALISQSTYYYLFPLFMLALRSLLYYSYWLISYTSILYLQLPLFLLGLQYGTILTLSPSDIPFWYLLVAMTLQIINERTQFTLFLLVKLTRKCICYSRQQPSQPATLPPHASGYSSIHSFHLVLLVYIYGQLALYSPPFTATTSVALAVTSWYKPIIVWGLTSLYQLMSLALQRKREDKVLLGFISNKWWKSVLRGLMLVLGMYFFYLGLALGVAIIKQ